MESRDRLLLSASFAAGAGLVWLWQRRQKTSKYDVPAALDQAPYRRQVQVAIRLALKAGANMYKYCDETGTQLQDKHDLGISTKSNPEDFYTKIDVENEHLVMEGISRYFSTDKIIGEEAVGTGTVPPLTENPTWIIDPIDGTTNFASGFPLTCVSIGYCVDGKPVMGVVSSTNHPRHRTPPTSSSPSPSLS
jgi:3'-phosphoadenosine 5'-phosphosulfate (PAPS) 3'-phosphatase